MLSLFDLLKSVSAHQNLSDASRFDEVAKFCNEKRRIGELERTIVIINLVLPLNVKWLCRRGNVWWRLSLMNDFFSRSVLLLNELSKVNSDWNSSCSIIPLDFWSNKQSNVDRRTHSVISAALQANTGVIKSTNCSNFMFNNSREDERETSFCLNSVEGSYFLNECIFDLQQIAFLSFLSVSVVSVWLETNRTPLER